MRVPTAGLNRGALKSTLPEGNPATVPTNKAISLSELVLPTLASQAHLSYEGSACTVPFYILHCKNNERFNELRSGFEESKKRYVKAGSGGHAWPCAVFDEQTLNVNIYLCPVMAKRLFYEIGAFKLFQKDTNIEQKTHLQYQTIICEMAHAWKSLTSNLWSDKIYFKDSLTGISADNKMFSQFGTALLETSFCVGEEHYDCVPLTNFLVENMARFKAAGFDTIYTEHMRSEVGQLFQKSDGSLDLDAARASITFHHDIDEVCHPGRAIRVFEAADRHGIRIIGIDSYQCFPLSMDDNDTADEDSFDESGEAESDFQRVASMNLNAISVMQADIERGNSKKYIVWTGFGHLHTCTHLHSQPDDVRGINMLCQIPSIIISSNKRSSDWGVMVPDDIAQASKQMPAITGDNFYAPYWNRPRWDAWICAPQNASMKID